MSYNIYLKYIHVLLQGLATLVLWRATTEFSSIPNQTHLKKTNFWIFRIAWKLQAGVFYCFDLQYILSEEEKNVIGAVPFPKPFYFINPSNVHICTLKVHISTLSLHIST